MIKIKTRSGNDYRLFDTETGKYVLFTAENRSKALFCLLIQNEIKKPNKNPLYRHSVGELADIYKEQLDLTVSEKLTTLSLETFLYKLDRKIGLDELIHDDKFIKLSLCVLQDQKSESTRTYSDNIKTLKQEYKHLNNLIFADEELKENL